MYEFNITLSDSFNDVKETLLAVLMQEQLGIVSEIKVVSAKLEVLRKIKRKKQSFKSLVYCTVTSLIIRNFSISPCNYSLLTSFPKFFIGNLLLKMDPR